MNGLVMSFKYFSKFQLSSYVSNSIFYVLFAGFFFYQTAIGLNFSPPFLGGFFGLVSVLVFPFLLLSFYYSKGREYREYSAIDIIFFVIIILSAVTSLLNFVLSNPRGFESELFAWSISGVLFNLICYMLAKSVTLTSQKFIGLMVVTLLIMGAIVFINIGKRGIFYLQLGHSNSDSVASYQGFGRSLFVVALYTIVLVKIKTIKVILFVFSIPVLFLNGARTEFILFLATFTVLLLKRSKYSNLLTISFTMILILLLVNIDTIISMLPQSRMVRVFDVFSSASGQSRLQMLSYAWSTIQDNPVFGSYGSYVKFEGFGAGIGSYAHNLLSAWVNLGIIGFALYISAIGISIYHASRVFLSRRRGTEESSILLVFVAAVLIALLFSKDYSYMLFGFMVGFTSRYISAHRIRNAPLPSLGLSIKNTAYRRPD